MNWTKSLWAPRVTFSIELQHLGSLKSSDDNWKETDSFLMKAKTSLLQKMYSFRFPVSSQFASLYCFISKTKVNCLYNAHLIKLWLSLCISLPQLTQRKTILTFTYFIHVFKNRHFFSYRNNWVYYKITIGT